MVIRTRRQAEDEKEQLELVLQREEWVEPETFSAASFFLGFAAQPLILRRVVIRSSCWLDGGGWHISSGCPNGSPTVIKRTRGGEGAKNGD